MGYVSFVRFTDERVSGIRLPLTQNDMGRIAKEVKDKVLDAYYNTARGHGRLQEIESMTGVKMTIIKSIIGRHQQELK